MHPSESISFRLLCHGVVGLFLYGCQSDSGAPETYEVRGQVVGAHGEPMRGGLVEFRATNGPSLTTTGQIQPDGSFQLATMVDGRQIPGAVAGPFQVTVMPPMSGQADQQHLAQPITLPDVYEVKAGAENQFRIELP